MNNIKNITIIWTKRLDLTRGGVHRIIYILMEYLPKYGYNVGYLYTEDQFQTFHRYDADGEEMQIPVAEMRKYLVDNHCDLLLGQGGGMASTLSTLVSQWNITGMKFLEEFHNTVLLLPHCFSRHYWRWLAQLPTTNVKTKMIAWFRWAFFPLLRKRTMREVANNFHANYNVADGIVLLSKHEIPEIQKFTDADLSRCYPINNPLSWEKIEDASILKAKKKEVLIVSRLYNPEKRIDRALRIWQMLEQRGLTDWTLRIVGFGVHEQYLKDLAIKLKLQHVVFEGQQTSYPYYLTASLFMLTSAAEGWGLTLTESMQTGTVPIAFDSYPALKDIITDNYDGCIIEDDNLVAYADRMEYLMKHPEERERIARNGLESCKRFSIDNIVGQWVEMLERL